MNLLKHSLRIPAVLFLLGERAYAVRQNKVTFDFFGKLGTIGAMETRRVSEEAQ